MSVSLTFLGGTGTVTGSKYLLESGGHRTLVDCGLFQGFKQLRLRNWAPLPVAARSIDSVVLTHAHLDHSGYLPLLTKQGFHGPAHCTRATQALCEILLPDSGHLQEQDASFANRHRFSKHHPALPLYTLEDAQNALEFLKPHPFEKPFVLPSGAEVAFHRMGHILGAASVTVDWGGTRVAFSGDIGRYGDALMFDPEPIAHADYVLVESTYGDRKHSKEDPADALEKVVTRTVGRGGTVIIPAFAVGRAQSLLYHFMKLRQANRLPAALRIFLDSPMAIQASDVFCKFTGDHRLSMDECRKLAAVAHYVQSPDESKALTANPMPKIIISASGMATGGRVLHHLKHYAPDPRNTILLSGFQAGGTRGAALLAGATSIKIHGAIVPVQAEVANLDMLSAHADCDGLIRWLKGFQKPPKTVFVTHGEPNASDALRHRIEEELGWTCVVPEHGQRVELA